ncbi:MAG: mechanosensitive ion channel [Blastocatellia bacterium]|nr:mechanosensitive ion channel [Blastocatellia bacterium]
MIYIQNFFNFVWRTMEHPLFKLGQTPISLWTVLYVIVFTVILMKLTQRLKHWLVSLILTRRHIDVGVGEAAGSIARYVVLVVGLMVVFQTVGIDLSTVIALAGALGIGIGLGLQNITNNFVSGLIILFERPIKIGDRIEVGSVNGDVVDISPRSTTVVTNDNIAIIVPNSEFISSRVINWSYRDRQVRFNFPIGVSYSANPDEVRTLLLEVAAEHPGVLKNRKADVLLQEFGASSINFVLRVWTQSYTQTPGVLRSELNFAILQKFRQHGIEIPFPQRDIHIRSSAIELKPSLKN